MDVMIIKEFNTDSFFYSVFVGYLSLLLEVCLLSISFLISSSITYEGVSLS